MSHTEPGHASCPVCRGSSPFSFRARDFFYRVTDYEADLYRCPDCGTLFQWPVPDRNTLVCFYPRGYWREGSGGPLGPLQARYVRCMLKWDLMVWVRRLELAGGSVFLDIGCGRGDWLALIRDMGMLVRGIEADSRAAAYARKQHGIAIDEVDADQWRAEPETADAVAFFHLLEHLGNPGAFLEQCRRALVDGGKILLRVPNIDSWQWRLFGKRWKGLEIPRHLVLFNPPSLERLLRERGFEIEHQSTWSLRDGPPALTSSLFPAGEPTRQQIHGKSRPGMTLVYLLLNWLCTPIEWLAALFRKGSMITVVAKKMPR